MDIFDVGWIHRLLLTSSGSRAVSPLLSFIGISVVETLIGAGGGNMGLKVRIIAQICRLSDVACVYLGIYAFILELGSVVCVSQPKYWARDALGAAGPGINDGLIIDISLFRTYQMRKSYSVLT